MLNGICYRNNNYHNLGSGVDSNNIFCDDAGQWGDPDDPTVNFGSCSDSGHTWIQGGEITGEYDAKGDTECCGDDDNEYARSRQCQSADVCSSNSVEFCCNSNTDCVYSQTCYTSGSTGNFIGDPDGGNCIERCNAGTWERNIAPESGYCNDGLDNDCDGDIDDEDSDCITCDADGDECSQGTCCGASVCQNMVRDFASDQADYRCAPDSTYCVDDLDPKYHPAGSLWSSNQMLCCGGVIYRCSQFSDAWVAVGSGNRYICGQADICGYTCVEYGGYHWTSSPPAVDTCCNDYDDDCDGDIDEQDTEDCTEANSEGNCDNSKDDDCDSFADWDDEDCCYGEPGTDYEDYSCGTDASLCCKISGKIATCSEQCQYTADCTLTHQLCWNPDFTEFCVDIPNNRACCSVEDGGLWKPIEVIP